MKKKLIYISKQKKSIKLIYNEKNEVFLKGPLGTLKLQLNHSNFFLFREKKIFINQKKLKSFLKQIKNNFYGLSTGWFLELNLRGIGFKCFKINDKIAFDLGYSNIITFKPTSDLKIKTYKNKIILFSFNKNYLNNVGCLLKKLFKIDRYKGKGIIFKSEQIKLKKKLYH